MKTVFNNRQACHVWANQTQSHGRGNSILFDGTDIFSYGRHYLMARIHRGKHGKSFALVNSRGYSTTTAKHTSYTWSALRGLMDGFHSPDPTNPKLAVKHLDAEADERVQTVLKKLKVDDVTYLVGWVKDGYATANQLRFILGLKPRNPKPQVIEAVRTHLKVRFKRTKELEAPRQARKEAERAERHKLQQLQLQTSIQDFRDGKPSNLWNLEFDLIRIKGDILQTSRGAEVPLAEARAMYAAIKAGKVKSGDAVGEFRFDSVLGSPNGAVIVIGCHKILMSEADRLFAPKLALIQGGVA